MRINKTMIDEMELLAKFPRASHMQGIKVHSDADATLRDAAQRCSIKALQIVPMGVFNRFRSRLSETFRHSLCGIKLKSRVMVCNSKRECRRCKLQVAQQLTR